MQEAAHELSLKMSPAGSGSALETLEALQDRWDALVLIMDMQTQRVSIQYRGDEIGPVGISGGHEDACGDKWKTFEVICL